MVLTLYGIDASPPVRAVKTVLNKLKISNVEYIEIDFLNGEHNGENFLKMNPQHCIPTMKDDDFIIWDSHAIAAYLVSNYAKDDSLYPAEPKQRAIIDQRLHFDSGVLFPALRQTIKPVIFGGAKSYDKELLNNISVAYDLIEKFLERPWLAGDSFTLADICCYATVSSMNLVLPIDAEKHPKVIGWLQLCSEEDCIKKANEKGLNLFNDLMKLKLA